MGLLLIVLGLLLLKSKNTFEDKNYFIYILYFTYCVEVVIFGIR